MKHLAKAFCVLAALVALLGVGTFDAPGFDMPGVAHAQSLVGGSSVDFEGASGSKNLTFPATINAGDFAIVTTSHWEGGSNYQANTPSGFILDVTNGAVLIDGTGSSENRSATFTKVLAGTEDGSSLSVCYGNCSTDATYGTWTMAVYRGVGALSLASITCGSPGTNDDTIDAPDVAGTSGQILATIYAMNDPSGGIDAVPSGMTISQAGLQNTNTNYIYHEFLTADPGVKTLNITNTTREVIGCSVLINDAGASSPATLSSATPSGTLGTSTTATIGATTDQNTGTFYAVVDTDSLSGITATQVKAGQDAGGGAVVASCNASVSTTSPSCGVTGLTAATAYNYAVTQNNANGDANVLTGTFTTAAAATSILRQMMQLLSANDDLYEPKLVANSR